MANKKGMVAAWQIDKLIEDRVLIQGETEVVCIGSSENINVEVKHSLSLRDYESMISEIVGSIFDFSDTLTVEYHPERISFAIWKGLVKYYTNIDTEMSEERLYKLYIIEDWDRIFRDVICHVQYRDILDSVQSTIRYKVDEMLSAEKQELLRIMAQIESMGKVYSDLYEQTKGINIKTLISDVSAIAGKDEGKIAKAVLHNAQTSISAQR